MPPGCSLRRTVRQTLPSELGRTQASSVSPVVRSSDAESATVTRLLEPLKLSALPNFPLLVHVAPLTVPLLAFPDRSGNAVPEVWSMAYAATSPLAATAAGALTARASRPITSDRTRRSDLRMTAYHRTAPRPASSWPEVQFCARRVRPRRGCHNGATSTCSAGCSWGGVHSPRADSRNTGRASSPEGRPAPPPRDLQSRWTGARSGGSWTACCCIELIGTSERPWSPKRMAKGAQPTASRQVPWAGTCRRRPSARHDRAGPLIDSISVEQPTTHGHGHRGCSVADAELLVEMREVRLDG
jgi:hypothetical protein